MTTAAQLICKKIETFLIPDGDQIGQRFKLLPFQKKFIRNAFKPQIQIACLSIGRGGGKSTLASCLVAYFLTDSKRTDTTVIASSFAQGRVVFDGVLAILECIKALKLKVIDSACAAQITNTETGSTLRCVGSDNRRSMGWKIDFVIGDELSQWGPRGSRLAASVLTSLGKRKGAKVFLIGTRPSDSSHFYAEILSDKDRSVYSQVHAADKSDNIQLLSTWRKANPALSQGMPRMEVLRAEARRALVSPAIAQSFRSLRLNAGTPSAMDRSELLASDQWARIEDSTAAATGQFTLGIDVGGSRAMTAAAAYFLDTGRLEVFGAFPSIPTIEERDLADQAGGIYPRLVDAGELVTLGQRVVPLGDFISLCALRWGTPSAISCDRFRKAELLDALATSEMPRVRVSWRGTGFKDGAADCKQFQIACLEDRVKPARSLMLRYGMSEATVCVDPSGNEKLAKNSQGGRRSHHRDDVIQASIMAVSEAARIQERQRKEPVAAILGVF